MGGVYIEPLISCSLALPLDGSATLDISCDHFVRKPSRFEQPLRLLDRYARGDAIATWTEEMGDRIVECYLALTALQTCTVGSDRLTPSHRSGRWRRSRCIRRYLLSGDPHHLSSLLTCNAARRVARSSEKG